MANTKWNDLVPGEFFISSVNLKETIDLYQKLDHRARPYNAVLVNTGNVCIIADSDFNNYERVEVAFDIKPTE
jgi:hypothetical protein